MSSARYEIVRVAGVGGMATVYLGRAAGGAVAIKRMHDFLVEDEASVAAFVDEGRMLSCIRHPNVVRVLEVTDFGETKAPALVLEWIDGTNLDALRRAVARHGGTLPVDVASAIACDMLAGLHAAHEATTADGVPLEIVHRDVSPENVLVGVDGVARLSDFGIAKAAGRTHVTEADAVKGKLRYLAPEQLASRADRRTDVYAAGIVIWELLTGRRLRTRDGIAIVIEILDGHVDPPSAHGAGTDVLDEVILRALSKDPEARFATARELADAIARCVAPAAPNRVAEALFELGFRAESGEREAICPDFAEGYGVALAS